MNCDQVFFVLTRGPFPSGATEDLVVEQHLQQCTSCWQIAEALRPAGDLFQEAISPVESRDLPGYWGDASPPGALMAQLSRTPQPASPPRPDPSRADYQRLANRQPHRPLGLGQSAAAQLAGLPGPGRRPGPSPWRDVAQVAVFLVLVTSAVCGLSWLCSF